MLSPATGFVTRIQPGYVSIFLTPFSDHKQYVPVTGKMIAVQDLPNRGAVVTNFESNNLLISVSQRSGLLFGDISNKFLEEGNVEQDCKQGEIFGEIERGSHVGIQIAIPFDIPGLKRLHPDFTLATTAEIPYTSDVHFLQWLKGGQSIIFPEVE